MGEGERPGAEKASGHIPDATSHIASLINTMRGGGQPLRRSSNTFFGQLLGADLSVVRVHTDSDSDRLNRSLNARAFTTERDIFFRRGEYNPGSAGGRGLLAHELTHVVQQGNGQIIRRAMTSSGTKGPASTGAERCSGWLRDPESTSIVAAKHYVRTELKSSHGNPETVKCELVMPDRFLCRVTLSDGTIITVIARPDVIIVGVGRILTLRPPPDRPLCFYNYSCPSPKGGLVLAKRECKSAKKKP